ncbi:Plasma-membrane choline transporter [Trypanosoma brucei equiperdum]|uniref:Choline transporter-like protein n=1 Tax=Trypanosoma brucei equiperdum TaxID=630700 RepID=A0A3L6KY63_9TRYP|nr:Plasma-membrane choline transporter [Trypanosoma brucei equiperdum]
MGNEPDEARVGGVPEMPKVYEKKRTCTDIVFLCLFFVMLLAFAALGIIAFVDGEAKDSLNGRDRNGRYCGSGSPPDGFADSIPEGAPFQSKDWSENKYLWYPFPLKQTAMSLNPLLYLSLGLCVQQCPMANERLLERLLKNPSSVTEEEKNAVKVYSYGSTSVMDGGVQTVNHAIPVYHTGSILRRCLPTITQPPSVRDLLMTSEYSQRVYAFVLKGVLEVKASWKVFLCAAAACTLLCFFFLFLVRFLISFVVWASIIACFLLLLSGGCICIQLYLNDGHFMNLHLDVTKYSVLLLCVAIGLWIGALVYVFVIIGACPRIRLVCALAKIASRVVDNAPSTVLLPILMNVAILCLLVWSILVALGLYNARRKTGKISFVPVTDAIGINDGSFKGIGETQFYQGVVEGVEHRYALVYLLFGELFAFLWCVSFLNAVSFTSISFVSTFWYFSNLNGGKKRVPFFGVLRAFVWTVFYHAGTLALGSLLIAILQIVRILLVYAAEKAEEAVDRHDLIQCLHCYLQYALLCFENFVSSINKNIYVVVCLTSGSFCTSACTGFSVLKGHSSDLFLISWMVLCVEILGKLFVTVGTVVTSYLLFNHTTLAPGVDSMIMPLILIGIGAYFLSGPFFDVFDSSTLALLICYCYDHHINQSVGIFYVPTELEHQLSDYSQKKKLRRLKNQQAAAHRRG